MQQASFYKDCKSTLQPGELRKLIRYPSKMQHKDSTGTTPRPTMHPFIAYYIDSGKLCHLRFVVISDYLQHDTVVVHVFHKRLIAYLKRKLSSDPQ